MILAKIIFTLVLKNYPAPVTIFAKIFTDEPSRIPGERTFKKI